MTTSTTAGSTTSSTAPNEDAVILAIYRQYWAAFVGAGDPPNPEDPQLERVADGEALTTLRKNLLLIKVSGQTLRGTLDLAPKGC